VVECHIVADEGGDTRIQLFPHCDSP